MNKKILFSHCVLLILLITSIISAQKHKKGDPSFIKSVSGTPSMSFLTFNNVSTYIYNNGSSDITPTGDAGFIYPKGSGKDVFFQSGPLWGGSINGYWAVGGSAYRSGLMPGRILPDGTAEDLNASSVRIYRVRSDYKNYTDDAGMKILYADEIAVEGKTAGDIFAQYDLDWKQWPAQYGAPFIDKDNDGVYNPDVDIPGMSENPCQTIWFVANDLNASVTQNLYGALPMKLEMQGTMWAFKGIKPESNTIFRRYKLINRNSKTIDSMYMCMWSDPDLGDAFDDLCGCDTTLSLGYIYNGESKDAIYGTTLPSGGFVLLQSPYIKGNAFDAADYDMRSLSGYKNLGMSSFFYFSSGIDADWSDPAQGNYSGALSFKNLFQSKLSRSGIPLVDPTTGKKTKYMVSGDLVTNTGWIDGILHLKNDRRIGLVSGPFTMNPNDTQQIVVAQIAAGGVNKIDNIGAVSVLKYYAKSITQSWKRDMQLFQVITPTVTASEMDSKIILSWSDASSVTKCEKDINSIYKFQGYNVYQLPKSNSLITEGTMLATYDIIDDIKLVSGWVQDPQTGYIENRVIGFGSNSGIIRHYTVDQDVINYKKPLYNFSKYFFGVTAYYVAEDPETVPRLIETPLQIITAIPQPENPGVRELKAIGDTIAVTHAAGSGDAEISVVVVDPKKGDGNQYNIKFPADSTFNINNGNNAVFINLPLKKAADDNPIVAGVQVNAGLPFRVGLKNAVVTKGSTPWNIWNRGWVPNPDPEYPGLWSGTIQSGQNWYNKGIWNNKGSSLTSRGQYHDVVLKFANTDANGVFSDNDPNASFGYRYMESAQLTPAKAEFAPFIKNKLNFGFQEFGVNGKPNIPIAAYDQKTGKRLALGFLEINLFQGTVDGKYWPPVYSYGGSSNSLEVLFIFADEYSTTANPYYTQLDREIYYNNKYGPLPIMYLINAYRQNSVFRSDDEILINAYIPLTANDKFTFTVPAVTTNADLAKVDIDKINVFPNPYYGINSQEGNAYQRFVTFTHLPKRASIKIFNIAGQLVRRIDKDDTSQTIQWNLATDGNLFVAGGVYVAHIELPDLGKVKILKLAVIVEQQYPVYY